MVTLTDQAHATAREKRRSQDQEPAQDVNGQLAVCQLTLGGVTVGFPLANNGYEMRNRLVRHERPYRPGAKLDSTGSGADSWNLEGLFENSIEEPGLSAVNRGMALYPDVMQLLLEIAHEGAVGEMIHPLDGKRRIRVETGSRRIDAGDHDSATVVLMVVEDSEDRVDATSFRPGVRGVVRSLAERTLLRAQQEGGWHEDLLNFRELCGELEGLVRTPGEMVDAIRAKLRAARRAATSVLDAVRDEAERFTSSDESPPVLIFRDLHESLDRVMSASLVLNGINSQPGERQNRLVRYTVTTPTTALRMAADVGQPLEAIMDANQQRIDDPLFVEPGDYRVWAHWP